MSLIKDPVYFLLAGTERTLAMGVTWMPKQTAALTQWPGHIDGSEVMDAS
jgi:hypothetical protein